VILKTAVNLLPLADQIVALGKDGRVVEQGTFTELNAREGSYIQSFDLQQATRAPEEAQAEPTELYKLGTNKVSAFEDAVGDKSRQMGDFTVYIYCFATVGRRGMIIFWSLEFTWAFLIAFPSVWLKWWSTATTNNENPSTGIYLGVYTALQLGSLFTLFLLAV
jgi:ATP-binding cassette, subfamily C (CFTR/MRP), member 1